MKINSLACLAVIGLASIVRADSAFPMLMSLRPVAVQAGQTSECVVHARYNLHGAYQVFVSGTGVTAEAVPPKSATNTVQNQLTLRFRAAANAPLGVRDFRVATPQGVSTLGQVVVVRAPVIREIEPHNTRETAQVIHLPATVCGAISHAEDVDRFRFHVSAGSAWTFHVWGQRLENKIHDLQEHLDPILTLRNAAGTILAVDDNYFAGDPLLHYHFAAAGDYELEIRDTRYAGNPDWQYAIEITDRPFITNVYPPHLAPGVPTRVELIGYGLPKDPHSTITVPPTMPEGVHWLTLPLPGNERSNALPVLVSRLPTVTERTGLHDTAAHAQPVPVPGGIAGRLDVPGERDCYAFDARAGEHLTFRVVARSQQSPVDSFLTLRNARGQRLLENDDARDRFVHADSLIQNWTVPATGRYVIEIRDLNDRGGPSFVYFLSITRAQPTFMLESDTDKTLLAPGTASVIFVRVSRKNGFAGEVQLAIDGLPPGVMATCGRILADRTDGCIILRAAAKARIAAANVRITGSAVQPAGKGQPLHLTAAARPLQEIYMPGGGRYHYPALMHTVSVGKPLDIQAVSINPAAVTLRPGESKKIEVTIERAKGFTQPVTLAVVYQHLGTIFGDSLPAGVTVDERASQTLLTGSQSIGWIVLKAATNAKPIEKQIVPVMAHVPINFVVKFTYCSEPLLVNVSKPPVRQAAR